MCVYKYTCMHWHGLLAYPPVCACAAMAMQNLGSPMQLGFPISNYTMSLALLERIDFWDTTEDAIGEDFHMFVKAYFKTHGQVSPAPCAAYAFDNLDRRTSLLDVQPKPRQYLPGQDHVELRSPSVPHLMHGTQGNAGARDMSDEFVFPPCQRICSTWSGLLPRCFTWASLEVAMFVQVRLAAIPSPINMLNLQAGGYWETIRARMVQAERHARGCADFAYCLKHARSMPHFSWRTVALCLKVGPLGASQHCDPLVKANRGLLSAWMVPSLSASHRPPEPVGLKGVSFVRQQRAFCRSPYFYSESVPPQRCLALPGAGVGSTDAPCMCSLLHGSGSWLGCVCQQICGAQWYAFLVTDLLMLMATDRIILA